MRAPSSAWPTPLSSASQKLWDGLWKDFDAWRTAEGVGWSVDHLRLLLARVERRWAEHPTLAAECLRQFRAVHPDAFRL